jgi:hypothetical protein
VEDPRILSINEQGDEKMKNTENEWMKLMMLVMEYFQLQNELTKLKIEEFSEWEPPAFECEECFAKAVEEAAQTVDEAVQGEHEFDDEFQGDWA